MKITMKASLKAVFTGAALGMIPVLQVTHAQQVVDPAAAAGKQSSIGQSLNGTPVQNIAAPNANGLSHNQFSSFNVGKPGLVINNSRVNAISQIGGAVVANPNLAAAEARLILNEVTSGNRSILQGAQELVGARAGYILANPNGITCDGCGFINFPRATLATGAPQFDGSGMFTGFGVRGGDVLVGPGGLNATGADHFDIITRSAVINGQVNAQDLSLRLGSNDVDYQTLAATARADGDVPLFALDSSALGGMYAGRISLIGTDAGVGVRVLGTMAASVSDIELSVNGQISFKDNQVSAQRDLKLSSTQVASTAGNEIELLNAQIAAGRTLQISGGDVAQSGGQALGVENVAIEARDFSSSGGRMEAGQDLSLRHSGAALLSGATAQAARTLTVEGDSLTLAAGSTLMGEADMAGTPGGTTLQLSGALNVHDSALLSGNTLSVTAGTLSVDAASNAGGSKGIRSAAAMDLTADSLDNAGLIASDSSLALSSSGMLTNTGKAFGRTGLSVAAATLDNRSDIESGAALEVDATTLSNSGQLHGSTTTTVHATTVDNSGKLYGGSGVTVTADALNNSKLVESGAAMTLEVAELRNESTATSKAELYAVGNLSVQGNHSLRNNSHTANNAAIVSRDGLLSIDSRSGTASTQLVSNAGGLLFGGNGLNVLVSRRFENQYAAGRRAYTYAATGSMLLGAASSAEVLAAAQDIHVVNTDSDIEARTGSVNIHTSYLTNTTSSTPLVNTGAWNTTSSGSYDHDNNPDTAPITIEDDCGTYEDHFNKDVVGKVCARWVDTRSQTMATSDLSPRARIFAAGDFTAWIEKEALNYVSLISAGNTVNINGAAGARFENRAVELRHDKNALVYLYKNGGKVACAAGMDYCFYDFPSYYQKEFENISPGTLYTYTVGMPSTVQAGGSINVHIGRVANSSGDRGEEPGATVGTGTTQAGGSGSGATPGGAPGGGIGALAGSPFFQPSSQPGSPFLFETDPRLMSLEGLFGSDLFLQSLGLDPTKYLRAGDPYFEQQLLRQQLLAEAGQLFIADGLSGENEQFRMLMENGAAAQGDLKLRMGVALTQEQIANLQKDIVWMVESEVNGQKVLVPQLYLSDATKARLADGARFVASNINVKTEGSITNSGAFVASNSMALTAGTTFTNTQGTLVAANDLSIQATGDILNQSGSIRGGDVSLTSTEGSIRNETLKTDLQFGNFGTVTQLSATATIQSTGNLNLKAQEDIVSLGGQIGAAGNASLDAGRDISLQSIEQQTFSHTHEVSRSGGHTTVTTNTERLSTQLGSGLTVGGDMSATAGRDINIVGSSVEVGGDGRLDAGRDIHIAAAAERRQSETSTSTRSWNSSYSQDTTIDHTTGKASTVNFGGNLALSSGGDTNIVGSQVGVGGDLNVEKIGGDLNIKTFEEKLELTQVTKTSSVFGGEVKADAGKNIGEAQASASASLFSKSKETTEIDATTHLRSGIAVGGDLNAGEGAIRGDVNITGSSIATGGDMNLAAGGDINILAANDSVKMETTRQSSSLSLSANASVGGGGVKLGYQNDKSFDSVTQTTAQVSSLSSGGDININAGGHFTEQGTQVAAGRDIAVSAESITSLAAQNTYEEHGNARSVSVGLGVQAETGLDSVVNSFIKPGTNQAGFDMAEASKSINALSGPDPSQVSAKLTVSVTDTSYSGSGNQAVASGFSSGGSTSFTARSGDVTFHGTQVDAGSDINISADKGAINVLTADSASTRTDNKSETSVSLGVSGDATVTLEGSGSSSTRTEGSSSQQAAAFRSGGSLNLNAEKDVKLVGTEIEAGGTAAIESRTGSINFIEARDTTSSSSHETSAHASISVNVVEKSGSVGGGASQMTTGEESSTGKAGSIKAGDIVLKSQKDITLVGTQLDATESATLEAREGKVDFQAVQDTHTRTADGWSASVQVEAGKTGGGVEAGMSRTDEYENSATRTGGSLNAKNLSITAGNGIRLEGTQVDVAQNASLDAGQGALTIEAAVSTETRRINNISVDVGASVDTKQKSGQASLKTAGEFARDNKVSNSNASLNIGGTADLKAAGGIDVKGKDVTGIDSVVSAGQTNLNGADVRIAKLSDVDESSSRSFGVSVGVIVPNKKTREMVADKATEVKNRVRDSDALNTVQNKLSNAGATLSGLGKDADAKLAIKDAASQTKAERTSALADRQAARTNADINNTQKKQDQKADFDRQQADDKATRERDQKLAAIDKDTTRTQAQKDAERTQANDAFDTARATNASNAALAKQRNADAADSARDAALTAQDARKKAAADKGTDSQIARQDAAGKTEAADQLRADKGAKAANQTADTDKARADQQAQKQREDADRAARGRTEQTELAARAEQARKDAQADANTSLTPDQREAAKAQNAKDAQQAIDTAKKQEANDKRDSADAAQDAQSAAQKKLEQDKADAEKARQEALATAAFERDKNNQGDGERSAKEAADQKLVDDKAAAERRFNDATAQAETDRLATDTQTRQKREQEVQAADSARDTAKQGAEQTFKDAKTAADQARADKLRSIEADASLSDAQKRQAREEANLQHESDLTKARNEHKDADTQADTAHATALRDAETAAERKLNKSADDERTAKEAARTTHETEQQQAQDARDQDTSVDRAKQADVQALADRRDAAIQKAADDARLKKDAADIKAQERAGEAAADREAAREAQRIQDDSTLNAGQKADALKAAADKQAADRETAAKQAADALEAKHKDRDDADKQAAIDAIDPQLSDADKQTELRKIDGAFNERQTAREKQRDDAKADAADRRQASEAQAQLDLTQRRAKAQAEATRDTQDTQARNAHQRATDRIDQDLQQALAGKTPAEQDALRAQAERDKRELALQRDTALAENKRVADEARASADAQRAKDDAGQVHQRESDELQAIRPVPADLSARQQAIDERRDAANQKADKQLAAHKTDQDATRDEAKAALERDKRNADIDANTALSDKEKAAQKKASEASFQQAQTAAQKEHDKAAAELAALKTPAEKAADEAAARKAEAEGARVKNPYALSTRAKTFVKKAERWKNVLTSLGVHGTSQLPPEEEEEEAPASFNARAQLAQHFALADRAQAMTLLQSPEVQQAAALSAAVDALREESREELRKSLQAQYTGKALGVLTAGQQREALADLGVELPADLPMAEVGRRFDSYLDQAVSRVQPDAQQMADMLGAIGLDLPKKPRADAASEPETDMSKVPELYQQVFQKGQAAARGQAKGMTPTQTSALMERLQP